MASAIQIIGQLIPAAGAVNPQADAAAFMMALVHAAASLQVAGEEAMPVSATPKVTELVNAIAELENATVAEASALDDAGESVIEGSRTVSGKESKKSEGKDDEETDQPVRKPSSDALQTSTVVPNLVEVTPVSRALMETNTESTDQGSGRAAVSATEPTSSAAVTQIDEAQVKAGKAAPMPTRSEPQPGMLPKELPGEPAEEVSKEPVALMKEAPKEKLSEGRTGYANGECKANTEAKDCRVPESNDWAARIKTRIEQMPGSSIKEVKTSRWSSGEIASSETTPKQSERLDVPSEVKPTVEATTHKKLQELMAEATGSVTVPCPRNDNAKPEPLEGAAFGGTSTPLEKQSFSRAWDREQSTKPSREEQARHVVKGTRPQVQPVLTAEQGQIPQRADSQLQPSGLEIHAIAPQQTTHALEMPSQSVDVVAQIKDQLSVAVEPGRNAAAENATLVIQTARLLERMGDSEMRINLQTDLFGQVDIQASVSKSHVNALIGVAKSELSNLLVAEISMLERALVQRNLEVGTVSVVENGGFSGGSAETGQGPHHHQMQSPFAPFMNSDIDPARTTNLQDPIIYETKQGLSIHA